MGFIKRDKIRESSKMKTKRELRNTYFLSGKTDKESVVIL